MSYSFGVHILRNEVSRRTFRYCWGDTHCKGVT